MATNVNSLAKSNKPDSQKLKARPRSQNARSSHLHVYTRRAGGNLHSVVPELSREEADQSSKLLALTLNSNPLSFQSTTLHGGSQVPP